MRSSRNLRIGGIIGNLSLRAKGVLVVAIPVLALLGAVTVFYQFEQQSKTAEGWVEHTFRVRAELRRTLLLLVNAETGTRGYVLTRRNDYLQPYADAVQQMHEPLDALQQLVRDNPRQLSRLGRVQSLVADTLRTMEAIRQDAAKGSPTAADLETSRRDMQQLRASLADMQGEEEQLLQNRMALAEEAQARLERAIIGGGILGLLGGLVAAFLFSTGIARRVNRLEQDAHRVAMGATLDTAVEGTDEIARLDRTMHETSRVLAEQRESLHNEQNKLEMRVRERTAELMAVNEELHRSNEIRQAVIQSSPLAIWAIDTEGTVTFWNPAAEQIFGWAAAEVIGHGLPIIPEDQSEEYAQWLNRFREGQSLSGVERVRNRKDGTRIDVSIWTAPLRDASGSVIGTIAIDSDITDRKLLEEQFRQSQKLEAIGRLAGGVAHDFNNLLTVIMGYVEMIIAESADHPNIVDYASEVQYAANRASALTAQLLAFSRRQISQPRILDLNEVVSHSMKLLRRIIGEDIEISAHLDPNLAKVKADPIHVDQVIMNLVVNARDAMAETGRLTIDTANVTLDEHYAGKHIGVMPGPYVLLAISDTGTGMTPEVKSRLFEPFFTTKEAGKGTGLGLSIVYGIVKQIGGEVMVYSELGKGTTFKIYFPAHEAAAETAAGNAELHDLTGNETVLLCEDEPGIRRLVHSMLERYGYRVLEAETPEKAVKIARNGNNIDLLLTDIVMPHVNGFELARMLRSDLPEMKVLFMSGYTDSRVGATWVLGPDMPFLQKPFTATLLGQKVKEALAGKSAAR